MLTLGNSAVFETCIRKSRFVAHAAAVDSQQSSLEFYESVADPQATHNCWAWRIDYQVRSSDDGEPGGTAGRPILGVIEGRQLENVMVVVTRYFGGIKLGVGGLARAYSGTAAKCLDRARVIERHPEAEYLLTAGFEHAASVHGVLERFAAEKLAEQYDNQGIRLNIRCRQKDQNALSAALRDISRGQARMRKLPSG